jgi:hypothetical protein
MKSKSAVPHGVGPRTLGVRLVIEVGTIDSGVEVVGARR